MMTFENIQKLLDTKIVFVKPIELINARFRVLADRKQLQQNLRHRLRDNGYVFEFSFLRSNLTIINNKWSTKQQPEDTDLKSFPVRMPGWFETEQDVIEYMRGTIAEIKQQYVQAEKEYGMEVCDAWLAKYKHYMQREWPELTQDVIEALGPIK